MRPRLSDDELIAALAEVFRAHGYEGTTLARASEATGLQKSSLYHRFPRGKPQMAEVVLDAACHELLGDVLAPLRGTGALRARVKAAAGRLSGFYDGGRHACLLETLSVGIGHAALEAPLRAACDGLVETMAAAAREAGLPPRRARARAVEALVRLQGALVVARASGDRRVFEDVLAGLPALLAEE